MKRTTTAALIHKYSICSWPTCERTATKVHICGGYAMVSCNEHEKLIHGTVSHGVNNGTVNDRLVSENFGRRAE